LQIQKFRALGRDYYNKCERKCVQSEQDLYRELAAKTKPFFEVRDEKITYNINRAPVDVLSFKVFSRDWYLRKIEGIISSYIK
jgi:hypothetical protein